jgi:hypothetical protein
VASFGVRLNGVDGSVHRLAGRLIYVALHQRGTRRVPCPL